MTDTHKLIRRLLSRVRGRIDRRFVLARPGSVLILVVALLVLMALIGTAWMASTRTDRYAAQQNSINTQIDLLVEGTVRLSQAVIVDDLFGSGVYRSVLGGYTHTDDVLNDTWMASRVPVMLQELATPWRTPAVYQAGECVTDSGKYFICLQTYDTTAVGGPHQPPDAGYWLQRGVVGTDDAHPVWRGISRNPTSVNGGFEDVTGALAPFSGRTLVEPTYVTIGTKQYPAFKLVHIPVNPLPGDVPTVQTILAADADGDGITDSGLWRLPIGQLNGVTYFAAIRVIDNGSAVNVNTALSRDQDFNGAAVPVPVIGLFTSGVGLTEMLKTASTTSKEIGDLNTYRFNGAVTNGVIGSGTSAIDDGGAPRADYVLFSVGDALWQQLGRRIGDPGFNSAGKKFQALSIGESMAMAYRFCLRNPTVTSYQSSPSLLEQYLHDSVFDPAALQQPFDVTLSQTWFDSLFRYDNGFMPLRPLLVARNPVCNVFLPHDMSTLPTTGDPMGAIRSSTPGDINRMPNYTATAFGTGVKAAVNTAPFGELWRAYWNVMADAASAPSGALSSTPFDKAFADATNSSTWDRAPEQYDDPYVGQRFANTYPFAPDVTTFPTNHPLRMFRSSIRAIPMISLAPPPVPPNLNPVIYAPETPRLPQDVMLLLRSAIAAVNTEDLRDSDFDVTYHDIPLYVTSYTGIGAARTARPITVGAARVFGNEAQPFITEVYANTDNGGTPPNPTGYIAVELYNPYPFPIDIVNCQLVTVPRGTPATAPVPPDKYWPLAETPVPGVSAPTAAALAEATSNFKPEDVPAGNPVTIPATVIPANGWLVLENYYVPPPTPGPAPANAAAARPTSCGLSSLTGPIAEVKATGKYTRTNFACVANLGTILNGSSELVLLRPLHAAIVTESIKGVNTPVLQYSADAVPDLRLMAPLDSYDFTGLALANLAVAPPIQATAWHYVRGCLSSSAATSEAWHMVYPGRYDATQSVLTATRLTMQPRHQGTFDAVPRWNPGQPPGDPWALAPHPGTGPSLGEGQDATAVATASYPREFPIQLNNFDFAGPNALRQATNNVFPFGGFARNGDILEVPFIGSYAIYTYPASGPPELLELNSVTMDSVSAEDTDLSDDPQAADTLLTVAREQVGRFCPVNSPGARPVDDLEPAGTFNDYDTATGLKANWRYRWCGDLFDYLTVQAPNMQFSPDVDPLKYQYPDTSVSPSVYRPINPGATAVKSGGSPGAPAMSGGRVVSGTINSVNGSTNLSVVPNYYNGATILFTSGALSGQTSTVSGYVGPTRTMNLSPDLPAAPAVDDAFLLFGPAPASADTAPVDGLININTAPWSVLAALPMMTYSPLNLANPPPAGKKWGDVDVVQNVNLAKAIVRFRDVDRGDGMPWGPFNNIFELNRVPGFRAGGTTIQTVPPDPGNVNGDITPVKAAWSNAVAYVPGDTVFDSLRNWDYICVVANTASEPGPPDVPGPNWAIYGDGIYNDFEANFLMMNRISNMITTRSDSYTVYVLVQGWQGVGTAAPTLVAQRRAAYIADRSGVTPTNKSLSTTNVPTD